MAMSKAQAQSISNYLHYSTMNWCLNNDPHVQAAKYIINIIDPLLVALGGAPISNPLGPS